MVHTTWAKKSSTECNILELYSGVLEMVCQLHHLYFCFFVVFFEVGPQCVAQANLKRMSLLPQPPKARDYRSIPQCPSYRFPNVKIKYFDL